MRSPNYVIRLSGKQINGESVSCTGRQLSMVLNTLGELVDKCVWFAADVSANNELPPALRARETATFRVGSLRELEEACVQVD